MRKLLLSLMFLLFILSSFASKHKSKIQIKKETAKKATFRVAPSGSADYEDACGNVWHMTWVCNYACSNLDVFNAITSYLEDVVDPDCYYEDGDDNNHLNNVDDDLS